MKIIIGAIVFGLVIISIIVMLVINFTYRSIKKRREEMEDDYYQHLKEKEQKEKHPFGKDYFKSSARTTSRVPLPRNNKLQNKINPRQRNRRLRSRKKRHTSKKKKKLPAEL